MSGNLEDEFREIDRGNHNHKMLVAQVPMGAVVPMVILTGVVVIRELISPSVWSILIVAVAAFLVRRLKGIRLEVSRSAVEVTNFWRTTEIPLHEARVIDEAEPGGGGVLSDAGGKLDSEGRTLYLEDAKGRRVHVGVAPRYGKRLDVIRRDLLEAMRIQGRR